MLSEEEKPKVEEKKIGQEELSPEEHQTINQEESKKVESSGSEEEEKTKLDEEKSSQEELSPEEHQTINQEESKKVESSGSEEEEKTKLDEEKSSQEEINPETVLPHSKIINIEGTNFKLKVHYNQLDDKDLLTIEARANSIFHAYQERNGLDMSKDYTFDTNVYDNYLSNGGSYLQEVLENQIYYSLAKAGYDMY